MYADRYGLPLSTPSPEAAHAYVQGIDVCLAANANAEIHLEAATAHDADFALPYIALAIQHDMWGRVAERNSCLQKARHLSIKTTPREQAHIRILDLILARNKTDSYALLRQHLTVSPTDIFIASQVTGAYSVLAFSGKKYFEAERLALVESLKKHYPDDWWFESMYAFSLTEQGQHDEARRYAESSLSKHYHNGHACHSYSHVLYETNRHDEGRTFLSKWFEQYPEHSPIASHNRWHQALLEALDDHSDRALEYYHAKIKPSVATGPSYGRLIDATALLWRMTLRQTPIERQLWQEINDFWQLHFPQIGDPFLDVHRLFLQVHFSKKLDFESFTRQIHAYYTQQDTEARRVVIQTAEALLAYKNGQYPTAQQRLQALLPHTPRIGGSHAQRDIFSETIKFIKTKSE